MQDFHCGEAQRMDDLEHGSKELTGSDLPEAPPLYIRSFVPRISVRNCKSWSPLYYFPAGLDLYRPILGRRVDKASNPFDRPLQRLA
jgi:hypothetical protein